MTEEVVPHQPTLSPATDRMLSVHTAIAGFTTTN
jgi:hypothetical protein